MVENTYWNEQGKYQELAESLSLQVPVFGKADKSHIDLLRNATNLYYDLYNNGLGNLGVIYRQWFNLYYFMDEISETEEEITSDEIVQIDNIVRWWLDTDSTDGTPDFSELEQKGLPVLLEKLVNATVVYAARIEGLR